MMIAFPFDLQLSEKEGKEGGSLPHSFPSPPLPYLIPPVPACVCASAFACVFFLTACQINPSREPPLPTLIFNLPICRRSHAALFLPFLNFFFSLPFIPWVLYPLHQPKAHPSHSPNPALPTHAPLRRSAVRLPNRSSEPLTPAQNDQGRTSYIGRGWCGGCGWGRPSGENG